LATSFDEAIHTANKLVAEEGKIFLLGGADVYNQGFLMPECRHILLTRVHSPKEIACDAFLAEIDLNIYRLADHDELESFVQETVPRGKQKHLELEYEFLLYLRK
jgi:dihydrofolate reductase